MRIIKYLSIVIVAISVMLLVSGCAAINPIEFVGIKNVTINQGKDLTINAEVILENPNNVKFTILDHDLEIYVEGRSFGKLVFDSINVIHAKEKFVAPVTFSIGYPELLASGFSLLPKLVQGEFNVKVEGTVDAKIFIFRRTMNFNFTEKVRVKL